nr:histidine phosphatase family protein [Corynebacterium lactis]
MNANLGNYTSEGPVGQSPFLDDRPDHLEVLDRVEGQRIIFIRHGQTTGNIGRHLDTALPGAPLTDLGVTQARALGRILLPDAMGISDIVTSHALRARQTGAGAVGGLHLLGETGVRLRHEGGLHEVQAGDLEGRNDRDAHMAYMRAFYEWVSGNWEHRLPGGESGEDVLERFLPTLKTLVDQAAQRKRDVVIVSHGAAIRVVSQYLTGIDPEYVLRNRIPNTERIELVPGVGAVGKRGEGSVDGGSDGASSAHVGVEPGAWAVKRWGESPLPE